MTVTNFLTYKVRALNSPVRRRKILKELQHYQADVVFLQETHLVQETCIKLYSKDFPILFYSDSPIRRAKEVAIGFAKVTKFSLTDRMTDPEGRYLFLKGKLGDKTLTLANVYCPNKNSISFLNQVLSRLMDFKTGEVILAGDFNFCLNPSQDSTSRAQGMGRAALNAIRRRLHQCQLIDVWRVQHADERDYTFFFPCTQG